MLRFCLFLVDIPLVTEKEIIQEKPLFLSLYCGLQNRDIQTQQSKWFFFSRLLANRGQLYRIIYSAFLTTTFISLTLALTYFNIFVLSGVVIFLVTLVVCCIQLIIQVTVKNQIQKLAQRQEFTGMGICWLGVAEVTSREDF